MVLSFFFFSSRRRHTISVSAFLLNRSSDLAGQYFTNDQIKEMTRKVSAEVDLVHQQTQNQRYGSSHIGATAKDIRSEERFSGMALLILALLQRILDRKSVV